MSGPEVIVIGAGPAGLTAATYLARFHRRVLVLDGGPSRAEWIPESHNTPGFPHGINGEGLLERLRAQAKSFGAVIREGRVANLVQADGVFEMDGIQAEAVLLATGVLDNIPSIQGIEAAIRESLVRMCPICDAFEATGKTIAVLGESPLAERERDFLRTYSEAVTILTPRGRATVANGLEIDPGDLVFSSGKVQLANGPDGPRDFDHLYLALGCAPQAQLAVSCGAAVDGTGNLVVDAHQMTSVEGLYAAGDVVRGLNQIAVAAGEAAVAATAIHNRLRAARR